MVEANGCSVGDPCPRCGFELMEISKENLQKCKENKPEFKSVPKTALRKNLAFTPICPKCDEYALGMDLEEGAPFRDKNGHRLTVHDLVE